MTVKIGYNPFGFSNNLLHIGTPPHVAYGTNKAKSSSSNSGNPPWLGGSGTGYGGQAPASAQWQFPQYSQTWAFTPPAPTPYVLPPAFDVNSDTGYANPKTSKSGMSISDLMKKYR